MTILYPTPAPVKSPRPFGHGILCPAPRPAAVSADDRGWWAAESARLERERIIDRIMDRQAAEFMATESVCLAPRFDDSAFIC